MATTVALIAGLAGQLFLGEAYPSGAVYLQPFVKASHDDSARPTYQSKPPEASWPAAVEALCLRPNGCKDKGVGEAPRAAKREAYFVPELDVKPRKGAETVTIYDYIPSREGMDDSHAESCKVHHPLRPKARYAEGDGDDFFQTISDYCYFDDAVMRYAAAKAPGAAYQVLAVGDGLTLEAVERGDGKTRRPLTKDEQTQVAAAKKAAAKETDCSTEPGFLDAATVLLTARVKGSGAGIRLSAYTDPGCGGHLTQVYVLDVTEPGQPQATFALAHYNGPI